MAFENLDDFEDEQMTEVIFDLEFQVNLDQTFDALPEFDSTSQASFMTMLTGASTVVHDSNQQTISSPPPDPDPNNNDHSTSIQPFSTPTVPAAVRPLGNDSSTTTSLTNTTPATQTEHGTNAPQHTGRQDHE